jgi:hypothetical protein
MYRIPRSILQFLCSLNSTYLDYNPHIYHFPISIVLLLEPPDENDESRFHCLDVVVSLVVNFLPERQITGSDDLRSACCNRDTDTTNSHSCTVLAGSHWGAPTWPVRVIWTWGAARLLHFLLIGLALVRGKLLLWAHSIDFPVEDLSSVRTDRGTNFHAVILPYFADFEKKNNLWIMSSGI